MVTNDIHAALDERVQATFAKNWGQLVAVLTLIAMLVGALLLLLNFMEPSPSFSTLTSKDFAGIAPRFHLTSDQKGWGFESRHA